jgi:surface antigen
LAKLKEVLKGLKNIPKLSRKLKKDFKTIILKESLRSPFLYFRVISLILFGIALLSPQKFTQEIQLPENSKEPFVNQINSWSESPELSLIQKISLKASSPPLTVTPQILGQILGVEASKIGKEVSEYLVEPGDTLSSIANKFNISFKTLIWANQLKDSSIKPGQKLLILPVDGVIHLVKEGDTIENLAKRYKTEPEKIVAFNELSGEGDIFIDELLIIPDGMPPAPQPEKKKTVVFERFSTNNFQGQSANYPYGQCTWWVAQKRAIPNLGHAKDWLDNAINFGFPVCKGSYCLPKIGAIISLKGDRIFGHVGYIEELKGDKIIFSEMNYIGLGARNYRSLRIGDPSIKGYIY